MAGSVRGCLPEPPTRIGSLCDVPLALVCFQHRMSSPRPHSPRPPEGDSHAWAVVFAALHSPRPPGAGAPQGVAAENAECVADPGPPEVQTCGWLLPPSPISAAPCSLGKAGERILLAIFFTFSTCAT